MLRRITAWYQAYKKKRKQQKYELIRKWEEIAKDCRYANNELEGLMNFTRYMDSQLKRNWEESACKLQDKIKATRKYRKLSGLNKLAVSQFKQTCATLDERCGNYNLEFIAREKQQYKSLFDNIESRSLDDQQRECVVIDEVNNLAPAAARPLQ